MGIVRVYGTDTIEYRSASLGPAKVGIGVTPTAWLHTAAGTTSVAPFNITKGALLSSPLDGAVESNGTHIYWTDGGSSRWQLDQQALGAGDTTYIGRYGFQVMKTFTSTIYTYTVLDDHVACVYLRGMFASGEDANPFAAELFSFTLASRKATFNAALIQDNTEIKNYVTETDATLTVELSGHNLIVVGSADSTASSTWFDITINLYTAPGFANSGA